MAAKAAIGLKGLTCYTLDWYMVTSTKHVISKLDVVTLITFHCATKTWR